jgi:hypothetical protein
MVARDRELYERDEPPVRARPLRVGLNAEAAVALLAPEQRANAGAVRDPLAVLARRLAARRLAEHLGSRR